MRDHQQTSPAEVPCGTEGIVCVERIELNTSDGEPCVVHMHFRADTWSRMLDLVTSIEVTGTDPFESLLGDVLHQIETDSDLDTVTGAAKYRALAGLIREALKSPV